MEPIKVDVWSDIACPWCFIGKRMFDAALAAFGTDPAHPPVEVEYHSFELSPDTPVDFDGSEIAFLVQHKGIPAAEVRGMLRRVTEIAGGVGLRYDFDNLQHTNTVLAHQLLHFAKSKGRQAAAYERLFQAYFEQGRHLGRPAELADLAAEVGLDRAEALQALNSQEFLPEVRADQEQAAIAGVRGVPYFLIDDRFEVRGAAGTEQFEAALAAAASDRV